MWQMTYRFKVIWCSVTYFCVFRAAEMIVCVLMGCRERGVYKRGLFLQHAQNISDWQDFSIFTCEPTSPEEERPALNYFCLSSVLELPSCGSIWAHSKMSLCEQVKKVTVCPEDCKIWTLSRTICHQHWRGRQLHTWKVLKRWKSQ